MADSSAIADDSNAALLVGGVHSVLIEVSGSSSFVRAGDMLDEEQLHKADVEPLRMQAKIT